MRTYRNFSLPLLVAAIGCSSTVPPPSPQPPAPAEMAESEPDPIPQVSELPLGPFESEIPARVAISDAPAPRDPELVLAESLESYESAEAFWMEGSFDDALAALDRAYALMGGVDIVGNPSLAQEKEDLRRLISQRVIEIYASRRSTVPGDFEGSIQVELNDYVQREIASFQNAEREAFLAGYERSGLYREMILENLREAGMPEQLAWLPMVESWFKVRALSSARALGMWQFISSTGYRYGLKRTSWFDERMDPDKSTVAALAYLSELHSMFGDWLTAVAAYNCGEARVQRILNRQRVPYFDRFWDLYELLPRETRRYVPRFLATLLILEDPPKYGFDDLPQPLVPIEVETVETTRSVRLADLDRRLGLVEGVLIGLNAELRHKATPDEPYELKVPSAKAETVLASIEALPKAPPAPMTSIHRVRRGENLSQIAERYHTSVGSIMRLNGLRNAHRIWPGQTLRVDGRAPTVVASSSGPSSYTVRRGDSLWTIAQRYRTTIDRIQRDNNLRGTTLQPGQTLVLNAGGSSSGRTYVVRRGDTLGRIAQSNRVSTQALATANGLSLRSTIYPGQRLVIPN